MPLISVIIPAYNPGPYLQLAVNSVIGQSFEDWELIVVDDGSPQDISFIAGADPRVRLIHQENSGQSLARNAGVMASRGETIAFLDQDDLWLPSKLEKQFGAMQEDAAASLCHTQFDFIDQNGGFAGQGFGRGQTYYELLEGSGICGATTVMVRRDALQKCGGFDRFAQPAEDYDLWLRLMVGSRMIFVPSCEARYRKHTFNQSIQYQRTYRCLTNILEKHLLTAQSQGDARALTAVRRGLRAIRSTFGGQAFDQSRESLQEAKYGAFLHHLTFATRHSPRYVLKTVASKLKSGVKR